MLTDSAPLACYDRLVMIKSVRASKQMDFHQSTDWVQFTPIEMKVGKVSVAVEVTVTLVLTMSLESTRINKNKRTLYSRQVGVRRQLLF